MARGNLVFPAPPFAGSRRQIARAQELLNRLGHGLMLSGTLDTSTRRALGSFQALHGLKRTRKLDPETAQRLASLASS